MVHGIDAAEGADGEESRVRKPDAHTGAGLDELRPLLAPGRTAGFVGSSGVGKSSIINALAGEELLLVGDLRRDDKGRHTTTRREFIELPEGGILVDTPGLRELGLAADRQRADQFRNG